MNNGVIQIISIREHSNDEPKLYCPILEYYLKSCKLVDCDSYSECHPETSIIKVN